MGSIVIKSTEEIVSCSDNGQHPLVYISLKPGTGRCQYCGQKFERTTSTAEQQEAETRNAA